MAVHRIRSSAATSILPTDRDRRLQMAAIPLLERSRIQQDKVRVQFNLERPN